MALPSPDLAQAVGSLLQADPARAAALAAQLRGPGRFVESTVEGWSMGPGLPPDSRIRIALDHRDGYVPGEVVAVLARGTLVVHRVVLRGRGASAGLILTRGDAVIVPDPPHERARVLGAVDGAWREGAWAALPPPRPRSLPARMACGAVLALAAALSWLSPRAAAAVLGALHRAERVVRRALWRGPAPAAPVPGGQA